MSDPRLDPMLGPSDEYMYECFHCFLARNLNPGQEYASYSRDHDIVVDSAKAHYKQTGHRVQVCLKKVIMEIY